MKNFLFYLTTLLSGIVLLDIPVSASPNLTDEISFTENLSKPEFIANKQIEKTPSFSLKKDKNLSNYQAQIEQSEQTFFVNKIEVINSKIYTEKDFNSIIQPLEKRDVTLTELQQAAEQITKLYVDNGYISSRAILTPQNIENGIVKIEVIEGSIANIIVEGNKRLNSDYISSRLKLGTSTPVNANKIEEQLQLLRANNLIKSIEASLQPAEGKGQSILVVKVEEADPFKFGVHFDNYGIVSTGSETTGIFLGYGNVFGIGDNIGVNFDTSTTWGRKIVDVDYNIPVNAMDGSINLRTTFQRNDITELEFDNLNLANNSDFYQITYRQPLIKTISEEFALSLSFNYQYNQRLQDGEPNPIFLLGDNENGVNTLSVIRFAQDYISRDLNGVWGLRSQFNFGVNWFGATQNSDVFIPQLGTISIPDSSFFSWQGQVQRLQRISEDNLLIIQGEMQFTPDSLLSSEQFVIGGGRSVRGYRTNIRSGDNGIRFSIEDRITLARNDEGLRLFTVAPFFDMGYVWYEENNPLNNPILNPGLDTRFLAGLGLGLISEPLQGLTIRIDYAPPMVNVFGKGDNLQDSGFYFSINYDH